jgi:hypothetical protein
MSKYGPNVTKLITKFIAREAVPPGGGLASGLEFFSNPERRKQILESAEAKAIQAIQLIKSAPDNSFGDDDERIASELLSLIEKRQLTMRGADVLVRCVDCGALLETDVHCDNCGSFHPTRGSR